MFSWLLPSSYIVEQGLLVGIGTFQADFPGQQLTFLDTAQFIIPAGWQNRGGY
jgi:hypothetical protein